MAAGGKGGHSMRLLSKNNEALQPGAEARTTAEHSTHWETGRIWSFNLGGAKVQEARYKCKHDLDLGKVGNPNYRKFSPGLKCQTNTVPPPRHSVRVRNTKSTYHQTRGVLSLLMLEIKPLHIANT